MLVILGARIVIAECGEGDAGEVLLPRHRAGPEGAERISSPRERAAQRQFDSVMHQAFAMRAPASVDLI